MALIQEILRLQRMWFDRRQGAVEIYQVHWSAGGIAFAQYLFFKEYKDKPINKKDPTF